MEKKKEKTDQQPAKNSTKRVNKQHTHTNARELLKYRTEMHKTKSNCKNKRKDSEERQKYHRKRTDGKTAKNHGSAMDDEQQQ